MIALLAAVKEETRLIRAELSNLEKTREGGISVWTGQYRGTTIKLAHTGIGKAAAAAATVALLNNCKPKALWLVGCGGAYPGSGLKIGDLALAEQEIFGDEGVETESGFQSLEEINLPMRQKTDRPRYNNWPLDQELLRWAQPLLDKHASARKCRLGCGPFVTVSTCTGLSRHAEQLVARTGGLCENMEGAAVALACEQLDTPLLELRGISNQVEDRDPNQWDLAAGMATAQKAVLALLQAWSGQKR